MSTKRTPEVQRGEAESLAVRGEAFVVHGHARAVDVLEHARARRREARSLHAGELLARVHLPRQLRAGLVLQVGVQCGMAVRERHRRRQQRQQRQQQCRRRELARGTAAAHGYRKA